MPWNVWEYPTRYNQLCLLHALLRLNVRIVAARHDLREGDEYDAPVSLQDRLG